MELAEKKSDRYDVIAGNTTTPWYKKHRKLVWIIIAIFGIAILIGIIVISLRCSKCSETSSSSEYVLDLTLPSWDGVCPSNVSTCPKSFQDNPPLLLISLDGFRVDYLKFRTSPTLDRIAECGVKAEFMYPIYPSKTFPNHYTIVTGLYPESHGVIDNQMYDPKMRKRFKVGKTSLDDPRWWQKEPIWVTAQKQGKSAACFFWPGADVKINGSYPDLYIPYNNSISFETRVDKILEWLMLPDRPDFLTMYLDQPDKAGHDNGPDSFQVKDAVKQVDEILNRLMAGLQIRNLSNCVNIIIISDHGMSGLSCDQVLDIRKYMDPSTAYLYGGPFGRIRPKVNTSSVDEVISKFRCQNSHMRAYRKEELPIRMHYVDNDRIEPVILDIDQRFLLVDQDNYKCSGGNHGYDNISPDMKAIFFAYGPSFKKNITIRPFLNIELYEVMSELISIIPQPNNGTRGSLHGILKHPPSLASRPSIPSPVVADLYMFAASTNATNCSCNETNYKKYDSATIEQDTLFHLPFGIPEYNENNGNLLLLYNSDYVLAYDAKYRIPRWTAFTITKKGNSSTIPICWSGDARVPNSVCSIVPDGFVQRPLYPPELSDEVSQSQAFYVTNSVLKSKSHTNILESEMNILIKLRLAEGPINVMIGPVFDPSSEYLRKNLTSNNTESHLIPSHIFLVITWCSGDVEYLNECDSKLLDVQSFLLPNFPFPNNCEKAEIMIKRNGARVKEIEGISDLSFYTDLDILDAIRLRTSVTNLHL